MLEFFCLLTLSVLFLLLLAQLVSGNHTSEGNHTSDRETIVFGYLNQMADILNKEYLDNYWSSISDPCERKFLVGRGSNYGEDNQRRPAIFFTSQLGLSTQKFSPFYPESVVLEVSGVFDDKITFIIKNKKEGGLSEEQIGLIKHLIKECKVEIKNFPIPKYHHI